MRRHLILLGLGLMMVLVASAALAQDTTTAPTQGTTSTPPTTTESSPSTTSSTQGAFANLSPGGQKIATVLCNAQAGGCPSAQSPTQTTSSTTPQTLTRDQIAAMKQNTGWGQVFKQMQANGQIPADVKNLGQLVSGRYYRVHSGTSSTTTITTASGKGQAVGASGSQAGKAHIVDGGSVSSASGSHSSAGSHGNGHSK